MHIMVYILHWLTPRYPFAVPWLKRALPQSLDMLDNAGHLLKACPAHHAQAKPNRSKAGSPKPSVTAHANLALAGSTSHAELDLASSAALAARGTCQCMRSAAPARRHTLCAALAAQTAHSACTHQKAPARTGRKATTNPVTITSRTCMRALERMPKGSEHVLVACLACALLQ